jgi:hypothetical protein
MKETSIDKRTMRAQGWPRKKPTPRAECEFGNKHTKTDTGPLITVAKGMQEAIQTPCAECPLRRDAPAGHLGGYSPEMYLGVLYSPASIACHLSPGFKEGRLEEQRHCTGVAAFRANVGHVCGGVAHPSKAHDSTVLVGADPDTFFATPEEFVVYHTKGQANG